MMHSLAAVWNHKRFFALQSAGVAAWIGLALSWFWLPDSAVWGIALAVVQAILVALAAAWLVRVALRFYARNRTATASAGIPQITLLAIAGVALPYILVRWHPELPGFAAQTASLAIRFGLAFLIAVTAYLAILSAVAARRS